MTPLNNLPPIRLPGGEGSHGAWDDVRGGFSAKRLATGPAAGCSGGLSAERRSARVSAGRGLGGLLDAAGELGDLVEGGAALGHLLVTLTASGL